MEAFEFFSKSERQNCFSGKHVVDLCANGHFGVRHNSPFFNLLVNDKYKIRAVMDTGSTGTIISEGAYKLMSDIPM